MKNKNVTPIDAGPSDAGKSSSDRKKAASRANGAKSRGPKTAAGKRRSSLNAIRHGLCSMSIVETENTDEFKKLWNAFTDRFTPADTVEEGLVVEMAQAQWMLLRARVMHNTTLNLQLILQGDEPDRRFSQLSESGRLAIAFEDSLRESSVLPVLLRYEAHYSRQYQRAFKMLMDLRKNVPIPPLDPTHRELPNEPIPITGHPESAHAQQCSIEPVAESVAQSATAEHAERQEQDRTDHCPLTTDHSVPTDHCPLTTDHWTLPQVSETNTAPAVWFPTGHSLRIGTEQEHSEHHGVKTCPA